MKTRRHVITENVIGDLTKIAEEFRKHGYPVAYSSEKDKQQRIVYKPKTESAQMLDSLAFSLTAAFCEESMEETSSVMSNAMPAAIAKQARDYCIIINKLTAE